ncbi:hypothetical protein ACFWYW_58360 [Nonomuraea sp. NPDC059023]|uniref:hypothetical protein n=1 Tax=unclassified Nonomuraea TaxID=2593643 RepID=UPI00369F6947
MPVTDRSAAITPSGGASAVNGPHSPAPPPSPPPACAPAPDADTVVEGGVFALVQLTPGAPRSSSASVGSLTGPGSGTPRSTGPGEPEPDAGPASAEPRSGRSGRRGGRAYRNSRGPLALITTRLPRNASHQ